MDFRLVCLCVLLAVLLDARPRGEGARLDGVDDLGTDATRPAPVSSRGGRP